MLVDWLKLLCDFLPKVVCGQIIRSNGRGVTASWPKVSDSKPLVAGEGLKNASRGWVVRVLDGGVTQVSRPLKAANGVVFGILVLRIKMHPSQVETVKGLIGWACDWLVLSSAAGQARPDDNFEGILNLLERVSQQADINAHTALLATALADHFNVHQVVLVVSLNGRFRVQASSHSTQIDRKSQFFAQLESVVNAKYRSAARVHKDVENSAYEKWLSSQNPPLSMQTVAVQNRGAVYGVIAFYQRQGEALSSTEMARINILARQLGPIIEPLVFQSSSLLWRIKKKLTLSVTPLRIVVLSVLTAVLTLGAVVEVPRRITASVDVRGAVETAIVAPENGYILQNHVTAGQLVQANELLVQLDDKDLLLEVQKLKSDGLVMVFG